MSMDWTEIIVEVDAGALEAAENIAHMTVPYGIYIEDYSHLEEEVLEIATGPGLIAKHVAGATERMISTDYSEGMIRQARKGTLPANLTFEVADATCLPYPDSSFDVVLIANALHVMPEPEKALREIDRVLRPGGVLIGWSDL